jgi:hypothetical protein
MAIPGFLDCLMNSRAAEWPMIFCVWPPSARQWPPLKGKDVGGDGERPRGSSSRSWRRKISFHIGGEVNINRRHLFEGLKVREAGWVALAHIGRLCDSATLLSDTAVVDRLGLRCYNRPPASE